MSDWTSFLPSPPSPHTPFTSSWVAHSCHIFFIYFFGLEWTTPSACCILSLGRKWMSVVRATQALQQLVILLHHLSAATSSRERSIVHGEGGGRFGGALWWISVARMTSRVRPADTPTRWYPARRNRQGCSLHSGWSNAIYAIKLVPQLFEAGLKMPWEALKDVPAAVQHIQSLTPSKGSRWKSKQRIRWIGQESGQEGPRLTFGPLIGRQKSTRTL